MTSKANLKIEDYVHLQAITNQIVIIKHYLMTHGLVETRTWISITFAGYHEALIFSDKPTAVELVSIDKFHGNLCWVI